MAVHRAAVLAALAVVVAAGCGEGFVRESAPHWQHVAVRPGVDDDALWACVREAVRTRGPLVREDRDAGDAGRGVLETGWTDAPDGRGRTRTVAQVNFSGRSVALRCDAQQRTGPAWQSGYDDNALYDLETAVRCAVGRPRTYGPT
jgi:hypothetical protein